MPQTSYDQYIQRVHRQHASLVVTFPYLLAKRQKIVAGDYLLFEGDEDSKFIKVTKIQTKGGHHAGGKTSQDRGDSRRSSRTPRNRRR